MEKRTGENRMLNVLEAVDYQIEKYGRTVYGRDALYAVARSENPRVPCVKIGKRRVFFPASSIDTLLLGGK